MKRIKSEKIINNKDFVVKIGTTSKKNPEVIYIALNFYMSPSFLKDSYKEELGSIEKEIKKLFKNTINNQDSFKEESLYLFDIPDNGMTQNKKTYTDIQFYFKPNKNLLLQHDFSTLCDVIYENYFKDVLPLIKNCILNYNFTIYKKK